MKATANGSQKNEDDEWFELGEELCKLTREEAEKELTVEYDMKLEV